MATDDPPAKCLGAYPYRPNPREQIRSDSESDRGEFAGEGAFAAVCRIAMDRAFFDSAIELGTHFADIFGGDFLVFRVEGGAGFAREGLDAVERAAVARGADFRLTGAFGGGFDVGHM